MGKGSNLQDKVITAEDYKRVNKLLKDEGMLPRNLSIFLNPVTYMALARGYARLNRERKDEFKFLSDFNKIAERKSVNIYKQESLFDFDFNENLTGIQGIVDNTQENICFDKEGMNFMSKYMFDTEDKQGVVANIISCYLERNIDKIFVKADKLGLLKDSKDTKSRIMTRHDVRTIYSL